MAVRKQYEEAELAQTKWHQRRERRAARERAREAATLWIAHETANRERERQRLQTALDARWDAFVGNDPTVVLETLEEAFEDNDAPAAAVGVQGSEVALVVLVPDLAVVPERMPSTTEAGNISLRKMSKRDRNDLYALLVCGYVLTTVRETLATAPGVQSVRIVAIRRTSADAYGRPRTQCVFAARFSREALIGIQWRSADAAQIIEDAAEEILISRKGAAKELIALDLSSEPELNSLLDLVDLSAISN